MEFSTSDNDNDEESNDSCAAFYGANWWKECGLNNINGKYDSSGDINRKSMWWYYFDNKYMSLKSMTLMFRQAEQAV